MKRRYWLILTVVLLAWLCGTAMADNKCGDNVTWSLSSDGKTLTLSGSGATWDYDYANGPKSPFSQNFHFTRVVVGSGITGIGSCLFYNCSDLTTVSLPATLRSVGDEAFYACSSLLSVTLPNGVHTLGDYVFRECFSLTTVAIPDTLAYVGNDVFLSCSSLTDVNIPSSWTSIPKGFFDGCTSLADVTLPAGLLEIEDDAFRDCASITAIDIPPYVDTIGNGAFAGTGLTRVVLPDAVCGIGSGAFSDCTDLGSIILSNRLSSIGSYAFSGCTSLFSITIPASVNQIDWNAFQLCPYLSSVTILNSTASLDDNLFDGVNAVTLYGFSGSTAQTYASSYSNVSFVPIVTSGQCGDNVTWSLNLSTMALTITGTGPMWDFTSEDPGWTPVRDRIVSVSVGNGVTSINNYAFYMMSSLTSVNIPSSVIYIGDYAFGFCTRLPAIGIPSSVVTIGSGAFCGCESLTGSNGFFIFRNVLYCCTADAVSAAVPAGVTDISGSAFMNCRELVSVTLPDSLEYIGEYAFSGCRELAGITIPENVHTIGNYAFCFCDSLTDVTLPESVGVLGNYAFVYCTGLTGFTAPNPFMLYGSGVFDHHNEALTLCGWEGSTTESHAAANSIPFTALPNGGRCGDIVFWKLEGGVLTLYGTGAMYDYLYSASASPTNSPFLGNTAIRQIIIQDGVTSIGRYAFRGCSNLTEVDCPESLALISHYAFQVCYWLQAVTIRNDNVSIMEDTVFNGCSRVVLYGNAYSNTEQYAVNSNLPFVPMDVEPAFFLPYSLNQLESEALSGIPAIAIVVPNPGTVIAEGALDNSNVRYIYCFRNSAARSYAINHGLVFVPIDDDWLAAH